MLEDESVFEVLVFVDFTFVEDSRVEIGVGLLVGLAQGLVLALFEIEELVFHVDSFFVLYDYYLVVGIVPLILEATELAHVNFLLAEFLVHLHPVQLEFLSVFESDELLGQAVLVVADVMRDLVVHLETVVVLVVAVLLLPAADVADDVLKVDVPAELVLVEEVALAEVAVGVHEGDVAELVDVSLLLVPAQGLVGVEFLLFKHAGLLIHADFAALRTKYHMKRLWSSFRCFFRKATEGNFFSTLQGLPSMRMKHLYSVSFSKASWPYSEVWKMSANCLSGMTWFLMAL